jgi:hypothetical protein
VRNLQGIRISRLLNYEPEGREFEFLRARHFPVKNKGFRDTLRENYLSGY